MNLNQTIISSPGIISQELGHETVLLDLKSEKYFGLDSVGTRIWQLIQESGDVRTIFSTLLVEYEVEEMQLLIDLEAITNELSKKGLVILKDAKEN